jgi:hypothetical protein
MLAVQAAAAHASNDAIGRGAMTQLRFERYVRRRCAGRLCDRLSAIS